MEEGFYEVDVRTLAVRQLYEDANVAVARKAAPDIAGPLLPGYHGKGLYSGQGRLVYANNGEFGGEHMPPDAPSGCLAEWNGKAWKVVRRNQFTEVTGPGGLEGNANPDSDPIWSIGWDHKSLILMLLDGGAWHAYRLPKASHTYDGAHGWNTEWPRIRDIGERDLLMTMHGMFWRFPRTFTRANSAGIAPRSTYLRVVGDFARWGDRVVFGSDDTAKSEFSNTRDRQGHDRRARAVAVEPVVRRAVAPRPSGRAAGTRRRVGAGGRARRRAVGAVPLLGVRAAHGAPRARERRRGAVHVRGGSRRRRPVDRRCAASIVPAHGYVPVFFAPTERGAWVRVHADSDCRARDGVLPVFERRPAAGRAIAASSPGCRRGGRAAGDVSLVWARDGDRRTLLRASGDGLVELDATPRR